MPSNYPGNVTIVDKSFCMYNMKFDRPVNINITYNVSFWAWVFRALVRKRPLHHIVMADCHFLDNGKPQQKDNHLLRKLWNIKFTKQVKSRRRK